MDIIVCGMTGSTINRCTPLRRKTLGPFPAAQSDTIALSHTDNLGLSAQNGRLAFAISGRVW